MQHVAIVDPILLKAPCHGRYSCMTAYRHTGGGEKIAGGGDEKNKMEGKSKDNGGGGTALMYARRSTHAEAWQLRTDTEV